MRPVYRAIAEHPKLELHLIVTGMHLLPEFTSSLEEVRRDSFATLHEASMILGQDSGKAMAQSVGVGTFSIAEHLERLRPDIVLLQGDRGEMLAAAIAAAHMNIATVHMSGGDVSGTIDNSVRNAISKLAHLHLTTCTQSTEKLLAMGEDDSRIVEAGEPGLDRLRDIEYTPFKQLAEEFDLPDRGAFLLATLHPTTDLVEQAASQMTVMLKALTQLAIPVVITYPNSDAGGRAMRDVLESWRGEKLLRIVANLGSQKYLSFMKCAAALVGNSSSGILEAPSFALPVVNIGSRQQGRLRACNVIDTDFSVASIVAAIRQALNDPDFRSGLANCRNPYGDGQAAERTLDVLLHLELGHALTAKWFSSDLEFLARRAHDV